MSVPGSASPLFLATAAAADVAAHQVDRSLRFNSSDSAYLSFTPSSAGNRRTFTFSCWVKRNKVGHYSGLFGGADGSNTQGIYLTNADEIYVPIGGQNHIWSPKIRDLSAWYHIVTAVDTTQSTNTDRIKTYINGVALDTSDVKSAGWPSQNVESSVSNTGLHTIGRNAGNTGSYGEYYLAEVHFVDGTALAATDFGFEDSNGAWQPKAFSGTYGTNGFYLKFADNSSNAALGTDSSGNSNTWDVHNLTAQEFTATFLQGNTSHLSGTAFNNSHALAHLFDSDKTNTMAATGNSTIVYSPSPAITADSFRIHYQLDSSLSGFGLKVNDVDYTSSLSVGSNKQIDINVQTLNKVEIRTDSSNQWLSLYYIEKLTSASGPGQDSLLDTPTNYTANSGNNGGNYATLNPLHNGQTLSNGNLDVVGTSSWQRSVSTIAMSSGKWYWEYEITASNEHIVGVGPLDMQMSGNLGAGDPPGSGYLTEVGSVNGTGANGSWSNTGGSTTGDVLGVAFDADAGNMYIYKNGTPLNSGAASHTGLTNGPYYAVFSLNGSSRSGTVNFGQRPFKYTNAGTNRPAATYLSLCTQNLDESAYASIPDGSTAMDVSLWIGNDATSRAITGLNFSPDFLWIKSRSAAGWHALADSVRGAGKILASNETNTEYNNSDSQNAIQFFDSNGFTIGHQSGWVVNSNNTTIVGWAWNAGTSAAASNTDGSITSNVKASQSSGFSIVSYSGNSTNNSTIGHGLNAAPQLIITKNRSAAYNWITYSAELAATKVLALDGTFAAFTPSGGYYSNVGASTYQVVQGSANLTNLNNSGDDYIAYCFAPVAGYSAFGSYTGNGSTDGPFVYTGFRPRFLMRKRTDSAVGWYIIDTARDTFNEADHFLDAADNDAESTSTNVDILSNGFKLRNGDAGTNASSGTYLYMAWAEHPFRTARAR